jgi:hypothetical protein
MNKRRPFGLLLLAAGPWWLAMACGGPATPSAVPTTEPAPPLTAAPALTSQSPGLTGPSAPIFTEVGNAAGVAFLHYRRTLDLMPFGAGVVVLDYDGDGYHDIYVPMASDEASPYPRGAKSLYHNNGDGTFTDLGAPALVSDPQARGNGGCAADFDNDGRQDLYATNWGSSKLFRNAGDGTFSDVTASAGVGDPDDTFRSMGCAWGDYDRDGDVDLVVVRHMSESDLLAQGAQITPGVLRPMALFHNDGDGTFTNATALLGDDANPLPEDTDGANFGNVWGAGFQPGWLDFDDDGYADLYVVNDYGESIHPNVLWRNDGPGRGGSWRFTDVSSRSKANAAMFGMGLAVGDYNLDGRLDLFMTDIGQPVLLANNGDGTFTDMTLDAGLSIGSLGDLARVTWGDVFFDYDNDGDEDLYVASGYLDFDPKTNPKVQANVLLRNNGDGTFSDVSAASGADDPGYGRGVAYLDFNNDGCLDLYVANLGTSPDVPQRARLFQNRCDWGNGWLTIRTVGTASNRDGIGARVTVVAGGKTQVREVSAGASNSSQSMLPVHFGLGRAVVVESVQVRWPIGGVQTLRGVASNQRITIVESP